MTDKPSAIVTGSRGFIGRRLKRRLETDGWDVFDWQDDVRAISGFQQRSDIVFHLAAAARREQFAGDQHEAFDVNVTGSLAVLNYCRRSGARCVLASTGSVYRSPSDGTLLTEESPVGPSEPYGVSKWLSENMCALQARDQGVRSVALRIFNAYGPGQHPSFLVPYIVSCLDAGTRITLRMAEAARDFVYVDDVVDALIKAASYSGAGFEIFNVGLGQGTRVIDLVRLAEKIWGPAAGIDILEPNSREPNWLAADISKARRLLGWSPRHDVLAGFRAMGGVDPSL